MIFIASVVVGSVCGLSDPSEGRLPDRATVIAEALDKHESSLDGGEFALPSHQVLTFAWEQVPGLVQERYHYVEGIDTAAFERVKLERDTSNAKMNTTAAQNVVYSVGRLKGVTGFEGNDIASVTLHNDGLIEHEPAPIEIEALGRNITVHKTGLEVLLDLQLPDIPVGLGSEWYASTPVGNTHFRISDTFVIDARLFYEIEYEGTLASTVLFTEAGAERSPLKGSSESSGTQFPSGAGNAVPPQENQAPPKEGGPLTETRYCTRSYSIDRRGTLVASFATPFVRVSEKALLTWQIPFMGGTAPVSVWSHSTTYMYGPDDECLVGKHELGRAHRAEDNQ